MSDDGDRCWPDDHEIHASAQTELRWIVIYFLPGPLEKSLILTVKFSWVQYWICLSLLALFMYGGRTSVITISHAGDNGRTTSSTVDLFVRSMQYIGSMPLPSPAAHRSSSSLACQNQ